jgi:hypothetical protein
MNFKHVIAVANFGPCSGALNHPLALRPVFQNGRSARKPGYGVRGPRDGRE